MMRSVLAPPNQVLAREVRAVAAGTKMPAVCAALTDCAVPRPLDGAVAPTAAAVRSAAHDLSSPLLRFEPALAPEPANKRPCGLLVRRCAKKTACCAVNSTRRYLFCVIHDVCLSVHRPNAIQVDGLVMRHCFNGCIKCATAPVGSATAQTRPTSGTSCGGTTTLPPSNGACLAHSSISSTAI